MRHRRSAYTLCSSFFLSLFASCGYQRPAGEWLAIDASGIYFSGVELKEQAIDPNYTAVCQEARDEIETQLDKKLPERIAPLTLDSRKRIPAKPATTTLSLQIIRCEIDVEQSGGSFTYYLSLPVKVNLSQNGKELIAYRMDSYEQVNIDHPGPEFEFTFAEPVARTLLLFDGDRLWIPAE